MTRKSLFLTFRATLYLLFTLCFKIQANCSPRFSLDSCKINCLNVYMKNCCSRGNCFTINDSCNSNFYAIKISNDTAVFIDSTFVQPFKSEKINRILEEVFNRMKSDCLYNLELEYSNIGVSRVIFSKGIMLLEN